MLHGTNCSAIDINQITTGTDLSTLLQLRLSNIAVQSYELILGVDETVTFMSVTLKEETMKRKYAAFLGQKKRHKRPECYRSTRLRDCYSG